MGDALFHIIALLTIALALVRGYCTGLAAQVGGVLGWAFGVVVTRIAREDLEIWISDAFPGLCEGCEASYIVATITSVIIYLPIYFGFNLFSRPLATILKVFNAGALNSIAGSAFCALKWLMLVSLGFNLFLCWKPQSSLCRHATAPDGNVVYGVMMIAPSLLGGENPSDLALKQQLRDARKISCINFNREQCVMIMYPARDLTNIFYRNAENQRSASRNRW